MRFTLSVLAALIVGLAAGAAAAAAGNATLLAVARGIEPVGTLWINAIRMTVIPLVVALVVTAVATHADLTRVGRLGGRAIAAFAVLLVAGGLFTVAIAPFSIDLLRIAPDVAADLRAGAAATGAIDTAPEMPTLVDRILEIIPANPIRAAADGAMLPVVVFSLAFGLAITRLEAGRRTSLVRAFRALGDAMLVLVKWVLAAAPVGIFALAVGLGATMGASAVGALLHYIVTLALVLTAFALALYPLVRLAGGMPLRRFAAAVAPAQAVAFSSRSSLAALPALIAGARDRLGAGSAVTGFALPLAVSVFRVNVPIAWVVGALFLGELYGIRLDLPALLGLVLTSTLISFSVPGIPSASLFLLAPVLVDLGLPAAGAGILIAVDAIPDMFKTTANTTAHLAASVIVAGRGGADAAEESPEAR